MDTPFSLTIEKATGVPQIKIVEVIPIQVRDFERRYID
jgi:hypothetical protein